VSEDRLSLKGVTVERGGRAVVREASLEIPVGEVTTLLGPNGAGKSSLVLAVGGVLKPVAGSIKVGDEELTGRRPERVRRAGIAIVPEGRRLLAQLTVADNIRVATYSARALSGGEQQMLVLAQALVSKPRYILIDELSLGLAPVIVNRLIPTIRKVAESGVGVLLIEQFVTVALGLANKAYIMESGRMQYSGTAGELREKPDLLHTAYLLRGQAPANGAGTVPGIPAPAAPRDP
jgi:branched-chain amino acid transport system ATP-binding protein